MFKACFHVFVLVGSFLSRHVYVHTQRHIHGQGWGWVVVVGRVLFLPNRSHLVDFVKVLKFHSFTATQ